MNDSERREQAEALLKILALGQEYIRQGRYTPAEDVFAELDAMDRAELEGGADR